MTRLETAGFETHRVPHPDTVGVSGVIALELARLPAGCRRARLFRQTGHEPIAAVIPSGARIEDVPAPELFDAFLPADDVSAIADWVIASARREAAKPRGSVGRFIRLEHLGRGATGSVWSAFDPRDQRTLAIKQLHGRTPDDVDELKREFRLVADVSHPNLVAMYELVAEDDAWCFTMDLVPGVNLAARTAARGATAQDLVAIFQQVALGLSALHASSLLHLDVKPQNIIVCDDGAAVLVDFGLARMRARARSDAASAPIGGTPIYMAPEILDGQEPGPAADWYAFGLTLFEAVCGHRPFAGDEFNLFRAKRSAPRIDIDSAPVAMRPLLELATALLEPIPDRRPDGGSVLRTLGIASRPPVTAPRMSGFVGRSAELEALRRALWEMPTQRSVCLIHGHPGVGKTACARAFVESVRADALVLEGRCFERESIPFKGFDDPLLQLLEAIRDDANQLDDSDAAGLVRLITAGRTRERRDVDTGLRARAFHAVGELLRVVARGRPIVIFVDDIQWADHDGADLLVSLLGPAGPTPILFVGAKREGEPSCLVEPLAGLVGISRHDIVVPPLPPADAAQMARDLLAVSAAEAEAIGREAAGFPLLVEAMALYGRRTGDPHFTLETTLSYVFDSLASSTRAVLELVALAGRPIPLRLVEAAEDPDHARRALHDLRARHLLRTTGVTPESEVVCYHDRVREIVVRSMEEATRSRTHLTLARTMVTFDADRPEDIAHHYWHGGAVAEATRYAETAAEQAAAGLAFARAAEMFNRARLWCSDAPDRARRLQQREAESLVLAGRGASAAPLYADLAESAPEPERWELARLAAENYMATGHQAEGVAILRPLLWHRGLAWPKGSGSALVRMLWGLARLRLLMPRNPPAEGSTARADGDLPWSAARGLLATDSARGAYYIVESLWRARRDRDLERMARSAAIVGSVILTPVGGMLASWGSTLTEFARQAGQQLSSDYLLGLVDICEGNQRILEGRWQEALDLCDRGLRKLRDLRGDIQWERNLGEMAAIRALEELGLLAEAGLRAAEVMNARANTGDLFGHVTALLYLGQSELVAGSPDIASQFADRVAALWQAPVYTMQHLYTMRLRALCALSTGDIDRAVALVESEWPKLLRSGLMRLP